MRKSIYVHLVVIVSFVLSGCSPVYWLSSAPPDIAMSSSKRHVVSLLEQHGFMPQGRSDLASGDIKCGRRAPDRTTFLKEWKDQGFLVEYHRLVVHEFTCDGAWHVVIVASPNSLPEAKDLRDTLSAEFSDEIASGTMVVKTRYRLPLE